MLETMSVDGIPTLEKKYVKSKVTDLTNTLKKAVTRSQKEEEIKRHISAVEDDPEFCINPEFPPSLDWFNTPVPLSFSKQLQGKLVVLDFFTYCCINCMHILPDLEALEGRHPVEGGVVVVGVHSAKFGNEKVSENILNAINRYEMSHPVVNDVAIELWERLGVTCWPTLVIISPRQQLLYYIIGEGHGDTLQLFMDVAVQYYSEKGGLSPTPISIGPNEVSDSVLRYPGKVCFDDDGKRLFVADSIHHRILIVDWSTGNVLKVYGSGRSGFEDGKDSIAQFNTPQGMAYSNNTLFVADTENHALRRIDLDTGSVTTIAGTGSQGNDKEGGKVGVAQEISSPWDVEMGKSPGSDHHDVIYIAMAGTHQIWTHFLEDVTWTKGSHFPAGTSLRLSGSGEEANRNNSYPHKSCFAQPSGLSMSPDGAALYVADSESSTIRVVALPEGSVKPLIGGAIDPTDLFAFGDRDGKAREVRLQHPLGVACNHRDGCVYIADSYNHKIKVVSSKTCVTLAGTGNAGLIDGPFEHAQFSEPGGVCLDPEGKFLVLADTNNHAIRFMDLEKKEIKEYQIHFPPAATLAKRLTGKKVKIVIFDPLPVPAKGEVKLNIGFSPPISCSWTEGAPSAWQVLPEDTGVCYHLVKGQHLHQLLHDQAEPAIVFDTALEGQSSQIQVEAMLYFCEESGICHMEGVILQIPLVQSKSCDSHVSKSFHYSPVL